MLSCRPDIPWYFRCVNALGSGAGLTRLAGLQFDAERLLQQARRDTGLTDFGDPRFETGLRVFLDSLEQDADLSLVGRVGIRGMVVTLLTNRLLYRERRKERAFLFETSLNRPLVILGMPRAGTTLLHRLLAVDPRLRAMPMWRLFRPVCREPEAEVRRQLERALAIRHRLTPSLDLKHESRTDAPEECIFLLNMSFVSHGLWVVAPVFGYLDWLGHQSRLQAYLEYADLLRLFQSEQPQRRLLLKAPNHSGSLAELVESLPGAQIIQLHREPAEVCSSLNSLFYTLHSAVVRRLDVERMARANLDLLVSEGQRNLEARKHFSGQIVDVRFSELVADPLATVRRVYAEAELGWSRGLEVAMTEFLNNHPRHQRGVHRHCLEDFGLTREEVDSHFVEYREFIARV